MRVIFTEVANETYDDVILFLLEVWTEKEINIFIEDVEIVVENLKNGNFKMYQKYDDDIFSAIIGKKHVRMYFRKEKNQTIKVLFFFDLVQNPDKIIQYLNQKL